MLGFLDGSVVAQEVYPPGNGVTLPRVVKEVQPPAGDIEGTVMLDCVVREDGTVSDIQSARHRTPGSIGRRLTR